MSKTPIRVFIGSGEASLLERKTLIYSLRKHCRRELDIYVFNGTHNAVERNHEEPFAAPLSLRLKYRNFTEFSNYRFVIPDVCGFEGQAIWLDSDMVCLHDISELFDAPMQDSQFLAKAEAYPGKQCWGLSVMLIDCGKCRFDLERYGAPRATSVERSTQCHGVDVQRRLLATVSHRVPPLLYA